MIESKKYQLSKGAKTYYDNIYGKVKDAKYKYLVNPCVSGDTWVHTSEGNIQVKDLIGIPFSAIVNHKQYTSEQGFWSTGIQEVFEIHTLTDSIKVTSNHKLGYYNNDKSLSWRKVSNFKVGDSIARANYDGDDKIMSITPLGMEEVYDCTIEDVHYYVANDFFSHNCGEISLRATGGYCVDGDTRILHKHGYSKIKDLVGKEVEVFNGKHWSKVTPIKTGQNQKLLRVYINDGSYLDCTKYHEFSVKNGRQAKNFFKIKAQDLKIGQYLPFFRTSFDCEGINLEDAYTYGVFLGDGWIERRSDNDNYRYCITLYEGKHHLPISGTKGSIQLNTGIDVTISHLDKKRLHELKKDGDFPEWIYNLDRESTIEFIRGWLDTDGCYCGDNIGGFYISCTSEEKITGLQLLLRRIGISYSTIQIMYEKGSINNFGTRQKDLWKCYIPKAEADLISGYRVKTPYSYDLTENIRQQKIEGIEELEGTYDTYCFEEQECHMGVFNNILTYQCVISDIVPFHCETLDEVLEVGKIAARFLIRVNTMDSLYQDETKRTMRIGVCMTAVHEFAWKFFGLGFKKMLDLDYSQPFWDFIYKLGRHIENAAKEYSEELGVNCPHTVLSMKPSGSVSKLFALTEGAHLPSWVAFMRWVQFAVGDPLIERYLDKGYPVEVCHSYPNMVRVGFPTIPAITKLGMGDELVTASEATPEEQYQYLMLLEKYWLAEGNNQISYTLKFDTNKVSREEFEETVYKYQSQVRCCSVMPTVSEDELKSRYEYLPEESITKHDLLNIISKIHDDEMDQMLDFSTLQCSSGACPL